MKDNTISIDVRNLYKFDNKKSLKAFVDIVVNDSLLIKGFRIVNGKNGMFVSMPQEQSKDKKWYESVKCLDKTVQEKISSQILEAYHSNS